MNPEGIIIYCRPEWIQEFIKDIVVGVKHGNSKQMQIATDLSIDLVVNRQQYKCDESMRCDETTRFGKTNWVKKYDDTSADNRHRLSI